MIDHKTEYILIFVLCLLLAFTIYMSVIHNDSLASKGTDFIYGDLGALWGLTQAAKGREPQKPADAAPSNP